MRTSSIELGLLALSCAAGSATAQCPPTAVMLQQATATWSQPCGGPYRPSFVTDSDPRTAWALGRCSGIGDETLTESLVFETASDVTGVGAELELSIFSGRYEACCGGGMLTVGRFRVWVTDAERSGFANGAVNAGVVGERWELLSISQATASVSDGYGVVLGGTPPTLAFDEEGVIEASGANPEYATYVVRGTSPLERVTGVRIEFLNEPAAATGTLRGPGRHGNGNCEVRTVTLGTRPAPMVHTPPQDQYVCPGGSTSFYCGASGPGPLRYQWRRNGREIRGAVGTVYVVPAATPATVGDYDCIVTGACGTTVSGKAKLVTCAADFNCDQFLDFFDYDAFVQCFNHGSCESGASADFNGDGFVDFFDYDGFVGAFELGC